MSRGRCSWLWGPPYCCGHRSRRPTSSGWHGWLPFLGCCSGNGLLGDYCGQIGAYPPTHPHDIKALLDAAGFRRKLRRYIKNGKDNKVVTYAPPFAPSPQQEPASPVPLQEAA